MPAPTGEEIAKLFLLYMNSYHARQLMGDLQRSRAGLNHPDFQKVMTEACKWADANVTYNFVKPEGEKR